ncbi:MAG: 50S ribosomal protein L5, partial [Candidatus Moranbacteria bacterium GW2011_GWD2_37_9]
MKITPLKTKYKEIVSEMKKEFGYSNVMAVPIIQKVVVNVGIGKINKENDKI